MSGDDEKSFKSRVSDVFAGLDKVGFKSDSSLKQKDRKEDGTFRRPSSPSQRREGGARFDQFKRTESIFKETPDVGGWKQRGDKRSKDNQRPPFHKPKNPMYDRRKHQRRDPSKYTKYSLADVKDVTDRSNTAAALDFLDACRKRRQAEDAAKDTEDLPSGSKVVFKKPKRNPTAAVEATKDPSAKDDEGLSYGLSCGNSKRIMPEAVVGRQNVKRQAATEDKVAAAADAAPTAAAAGTKAKSKKEKKLSHLSFDDDDDEDDC